MSERGSKESVMASPEGATADEHPALRTLRLALADEALLAVPAFFGIALCAIAARAPRTEFDQAQCAWLASQECNRLRGFFKRTGEHD